MKGTVYKVKHKKSGHKLTYLVVKDVSEQSLRLVNMSSFNIMEGFRARNRENIVDYIENVLKCDILSEEITSK